MNISITQFPEHRQQKTGWISKARELYKIKRALKELTDQEKSLMDILKGLSSYESSKGGGFVFTKNVRLGNVQYKEIPELKSLDLEPYRGKEIESWKLERK